MKTVFGLLLLISAGVEHGNSATTPPENLFSPHGEFSIKIFSSEKPGALLKNSSFIALCCNNVILSKHSTQGYLIDAHWSVNMKYVAVNNRRYNNGDYLWIFSLNGGQAIKTPNDGNIEFIVNNIIAKQYPNFLNRTPSHHYTYAVGWDKQNALHIQTKVTFVRLEGEFLINESYKIDNGKLFLIKRDLFLNAERHSRDHSTFGK